MERDGLLDVVVPVGPVVAAGELLVLVGDLHLFEVGVEGPVLVEEEVLESRSRSAWAGIRPWSIFSTMANGSSGPPDGDLPKILENSGLSCFDLPGVQPEEPEGARVGIDAAEHLVMLQADLDRPVTRPSRARRWPGRPARPSRGRSGRPGRRCP